MADSRDCEAKSEKLPTKECIFFQQLFKAGFPGLKNFNTWLKIND